MPDFAKVMRLSPGPAKVLSVTKSAPDFTKVLCLPQNLHLSLQKHAKALRVLQNVGTRICERNVLRLS